MSRKKLPDREVVGIKGDLSSVILDNDEIVLVTHWFCGEEDVQADHPDGISCIVAGPTSDGGWLTVVLGDYDFDQPNH